MPTYAELATEAVYRAEYEPPALAAFNSRLRAHFGHDRTQTTSRGDNRHLTGRHRSRAWVSTSRFCTNRSYGTRDGRDTRGPGDALRATDCGLQGQALRDASARVDAAVRAGKLPELAEWFGTIDGRTVVGWFEGHASSSDSSHLYHLHLGYWTEQTDSAAFFDRLFNVITGDDMGDLDYTGWARPEAVGNRPAALLVAEVWTSELRGEGAYGGKTFRQKQLDRIEAAAIADEARDKAVLAAVTALATAGGVDAAPIVAAVNAAKAEVLARLGELQAENDSLRTRLAAALAPE